MTYAHIEFEICKLKIIMTPRAKNPRGGDSAKKSKNLSLKK